MQIAVLDDAADCHSKGEQLATRLDLQFINQPIESIEYYLFYEENALKVMRFDEKTKASFFIDFSSTKAKHQKLNQGKGKLPIAKACGIKQNQRPQIIDATAGFGQDSFLLASLGCDVVCVEQQAVIAELLSDALVRAKEGSTLTSDIAHRIQLHITSAEEYLMTHSAEVVYLDPMYPTHEHQKQAKVKKQMQFLRNFDGTESNEQTLFAAGFKAAKLRLVVKRPNWATPLAGEKPTFHIPGKTHRYDVYQQVGKC